jgi:UDP-N-acetylmuramoyl-tripeptide--D-alanyl-D-alanine ligase
MLLELRPEHQYAVMELGASHKVKLTIPQTWFSHRWQALSILVQRIWVSLVGVKKFVRAKSEIYRHIAVEGTSIVPAADDFTDKLTQLSKRKTLSFGEGGDVFAEQIQLHPQSASFVLHTPQGSASVELPFAGLHNVQNALAACAFALAIGISLKMWYKVCNKRVQKGV